MTEPAASTAFSHVASLGRRCRTTHRLRRFFGFDTAFPFDWWITPLDGAVRFLRDWDLDRLYDPARLREVRRRGRLAFIEHADYAIRLQHEFPMDARETVLPGWGAAIPEARARTAHLMDKFDRLDRPDRRILFVRELAREEEGETALIADLREAALAHAPRAEAAFLLISPGGVAADGWISLGIDDPVERPWTGDADLWDRALAGLGLRFERPPGWGRPAGAAASVSDPAPPSR
ncbi:MAG: DUF1796 family putative cysteine peptidase [Caulobacteraceae bacterium]